MIQQQTLLKVADNTGAKEVMCIRVMGGSKEKICSSWRRNHLQCQEGNTGRVVKKGDVVKSCCSQNG